MTSLEEAKRSVRATLRVATGDWSAIDQIGADVDAARRAFWVVALLALPTIALILAAPPGEDGVPPSLSLNLGLFAIGWLFLPAALTWIAPAIGRGERLFQTIAAYVWINAVIYVLQLAVQAPFVLGWISIDAVAGFGLLVLLSAIWAQSSVLAAALRLRLAAGFALTLLDLLFGEAVPAVIAAFGSAPPPA